MKKVIFCTFEKDDFDITIDETSNELSSSNSTEHIPVASTSNTIESDSVNDLPRPGIYNLIEKTPVPLTNSSREGENVCFFSSVVQVLFSLIPVRECILSDLLDNHVIRNIRHLFRTINESVSS